MLGANGESRSDGDIRQAVVGQHFADNVTADFGGGNALSHIEVQHGAEIGRASCRERV